MRHGIRGFGMEYLELFFICLEAMQKYRCVGCVGCELRETLLTIPGILTYFLHTLLMFFARCKLLMLPVYLSSPPAFPLKESKHSGQTCYCRVPLPVPCSLPSNPQCSARTVPGVRIPMASIPAADHTAPCLRQNSLYRVDQQLLVFSSLTLLTRIIQLHLVMF